MVKTKITVAEAVEILQKMPPHKLLAVDFDDDYEFVSGVRDFGNYVGFFIEYDKE